MGHGLTMAMLVIPRGYINHQMILIMFGQKKVTSGRSKPYKVVPASDVSWFINPINYRYIYHKP